jgi:iron complex transport system substrate-binding protein
VKIVSLLPSATEIVYALGLDDHLAGVTFECDAPLDARERHPVLVGGQVTAGLTPVEIDATVRAQVAAGGALYHLDTELLGRIDPDVILTQDLCRVCALPAGDVDDALRHLGCRADVVTLDPHRLDEVLATIEVVAERAGARERGEALAGGLRERLDAVRAAVEPCDRTRVVVLEWIDPPFTAGHWVPDLVEAAGGEAVLSAAGGRSVETSWDAVADARPDAVLVAPCGFGLADASAQAVSVLRHLPAGVPVWAIDANALVVRPGPRLVDGVEAIAWLLHADVMPPPPPGRVATVR